MKLKETIRNEMEKIRDLVNTYPWENPKAYAMWLAQTYHMVSYSTRLVAMAGAYVPVGNESLHARFVDHSKEERGHQLVCVSDIQSLGYKLNDFPQTFQAQAMFQIQYFWIQNRGAASFFGYTLALECLGEYYGPQIGARVFKAHGPKATKFILLHSEDDQEHTEIAYQHIDKLSEAELEVVKENLLLSCEIYRSMLSDLHAIAKGFSSMNQAA